MNRKLVLFGGGGFAREVAWLVSDINHSLPSNVDMPQFLCPIEMRGGSGRVKYFAAKAAGVW